MKDKKVNKPTRDIEYGVKSLRISDETWKALKQLREENNISWEIFLKQMVKLYGDKKL